MARTTFGVAMLLVVACQSDCRRGDCYPPGVYVESDPSLDTASARICLDDDCVTVPALADATDIFTGFNRNEWTEGRHVRLRIDVYDSSGQLVGSISEDRTMNTQSCACGVLFCDWRNGRLHRLN